MNIFKSAWNYYCPRCREGKIFTEPLVLSEPLNMPEKCSVCGQRTNPEPGFYYGSMFLSYILSGFLLLGTALLLVFYFGWTANQAMLFVLFLAAVIYLKILRVSRSIWIHAVVKYDSKSTNQDITSD